MANVVEVLDHWAAGRPLRAIAFSLGLDRKMVRNQLRRHVIPATPREPAYPQKAGRHLSRACTGNSARHETKLLPGRSWRRDMRRSPRRRRSIDRARVATAADDAGLQASHPSFRCYAPAMLRDANTRRPGIAVRGDDRAPGEDAQVDYGRLGKLVDPVTGEGMILNAFVMVLSFRTALSWGLWEA